jgi:hypothetical protein
MAKRRKSKGRRRGGKKSKKGHKQAKQSLLLQGAAVWDGYKFITADVGGQSVGHRLLGAVKDPAQRAVITSGQLTRPAVDSTRELQMVALFKVAQKFPLIKGPANMAANALNSLGRQFGIKGKYKVI